MTDCETHKWVFQGVVFWDGSHRPGSSARDRIYGDKYFCERCLECRILNERVHGNNYQSPMPEAMPR